MLVRVQVRSIEARSAVFPCLRLPPAPVAIQCTAPSTGRMAPNGPGNPWSLLVSAADSADSLTLLRQPTAKRSFHPTQQHAKCPPLDALISDRLNVANPLAYQFHPALSLNFSRSHVAWPTTRYAKQISVCVITIPLSYFVSFLTLWMTDCLTVPGHATAPCRESCQPTWRFRHGAAHRLQQQMASVRPPNFGGAIKGTSGGHRLNRLPVPPSHRHVSAAYPCLGFFFGMHSNLFFFFLRFKFYRDRHRSYHLLVIAAFRTKKYKRYGKRFAAIINLMFSHLLPNVGI